MKALECCFCCIVICISVACRIDSVQEPLLPMRVALEKFFSAKLHRSRHSNICSRGSGSRDSGGLSRWQVLWIDSQSSRTEQEVTLPLPRLNWWHFVALKSAIFSSYLWEENLAKKSSLNVMAMIGLSHEKKNHDKTIFTWILKGPWKTRKVPLQVWPNLVHVKSCGDRQCLLYPRLS